MDGSNIRLQSGRETSVHNTRCRTRLSFRTGGYASSRQEFRDPPSAAASFFGEGPQTVALCWTADVGRLSASRLSLLSYPELAEGPDRAGRRLILPTPLIRH